MKEFQNVDLEVIDPMKHEGVWAIPDDGCNSTTHGGKWGQDANKKFRKKGVELKLVAEKGTSFSGIGKARAKGQYKLPLCVKLRETGFVPLGTVVSWEVPGESFPMLLSQLSLIHI